MEPPRDIWIFPSGNEGPFGSLLDEATTTADVNVIAWNQAYCLFLSASLTKKASYMVHYLYDRDVVHLANLTEEGIKTKLSILNQRKRPTATEAITSPRRIGDKHTFAVELNTERIDTPATITEQQNLHAIALQSMTFHLEKKEHDPYERERLVMQYMRCYDTIAHPLLRHTYFVLGGDSSQTIAYRGKCEELERYLDELTLLELMKIPAPERPPLFDQFKAGRMRGRSLLGTFPLPKTWTFFDEEAVEFLNDAWADLLVGKKNGQKRKRGDKKRSLEKS